MSNKPLKIAIASWLTMFTIPVFFIWFTKVVGIDWVLLLGLSALFSTITGTGIYFIWAIDDEQSQKKEAGR